MKTLGVPKHNNTADGRGPSCNDNGWSGKPLLQAAIPTGQLSSVQFIYASRPSTKYFIRNTETGSDGRSCYFSHTPKNSCKTTKYKWNIIAKKNKCKCQQNRCTKLTAPHVEKYKKIHKGNPQKYAVLLERINIATQGRLGETTTVARSQPRYHTTNPWCSEDSYQAVISLDINMFRKHFHKNIFRKHFHKNIFREHFHINIFREHFHSSYFWRVSCRRAPALQVLSILNATITEKFMFMSYTRERSVRNKN